MHTVRQILDDKGGDIVHVAPDAPVLDAIRCMAERSVGAVLVMQGGELVGIASERDYARKVILQGRASHDTPVSDIMSAPVVTALPDDTVASCMRTMTDRRLRHLPVVEGGRVVGVISIGDLVKAVIEDQQLQIDALQRYIGS
ncbi:CBS domain-containing protein [Coralloluteibacterium stylophorae]|uniref:CBS domain-containing protein n=1 Tax=Coralloluteibacterium stylophorae TaxID=1776034 RepID=A0A8J7VTZ0_9GAMM|nr:CBS domain-containing protein [Coralloluteibacterium stylophorae]MBS7456075.1 CBS domain-containing protein [Coralloluteibacterium stylophorae]